MWPCILTNVFLIKPTDTLISQIYWCRIHLWFRLMGGLQAKSMTSQIYRAITRWRICVTMATLWQQDGGYALLFYIFNSTVIDWTCFLSRNSTCFGQFLCPSSGIFHRTFGTGICHTGLMTTFKHDQDGRAWKLSSNLHDIYQYRMYGGKFLMMGRGTARNM